jgi:hypothetical protein
LGYQNIERVLVGAAALRLPQHRRVWYQAAGGELLEDVLVCARHTARGIYIFDAHQPLTAVGPGI